ncbi:MAG: branched-chain amino acid ABC transporter permease [Candidatus Bipolaricaulota bacterium]
MQLIANGIMMGAIISVGAVGLTLVSRILHFFYFGYAGMLVFGAYLTLTFFNFLKLPLIVSFLISIPLLAVLAILIDNLTFKWLRVRGTGPFGMMVVGIGLELLLRSGVRLIWGSDVMRYDLAITRALDFPFGIKITRNQLIIITASLVLMYLLHLFLNNTKIGKAMRATADNLELAKVRGIDTEKVIRWTWALAAISACAAGFFLALDTRLVPIMGWKLLLPLFAAVILGGVGNPYGAVVGGMVIGLSQEISAGFMAPSYKPAVAFLIMTLTLLVKPSGLFGRGG